MSKRLAHSIPEYAYESAKKLADQAELHKGKTFEQLYEEFKPHDSAEMQLIQEIMLINDMKYTKSRKKRAEALRKRLKKITIICGCIDKNTGKICARKPHIREDGTTNGRCRSHGGNTMGPATPEGKARSLAQLNPRARLVNGLYSHFSMTQEELDFYVGMMNHYIEAYDLDPINILLLDRGTRNFILNQRKERAEAEEILEENKAYNDYDSKFLKYMQALGLDRKFTLSREHKDNAQVVDLAVLLGGNTHEVKAKDVTEEK